MRIDRWPDPLRAFVAGAGNRAHLLIERRVDVGHVLDRHDDLQVEFLRSARVGNPHRPVSAEILRHFLQRTLGGGKADALRRAHCQLFQPLQGEREVRPALGAGHCVDLVDDHRIDRPQYFARPRREHQVERLRRGDQDVRRVSADVLALFRRRVPGARAHADLRQRLAFPRGRDSQPCQRAAQVAFDIVGKRFQRRDVEDGHAFALGGPPVFLGR